MKIITIDTGTTNTRVSLWDNNLHIEIEKRDIGVRNTSIEGSNQSLKLAISDCINTILTKCGLIEADIDTILASGMITSNLGLHEVPHLIAPVTLNDFVKGLISVVIPEISSKPITFIPGVKNQINTEQQNWDDMDIMRGEEVEALALTEYYQIDQPVILALPGSHSKFIAIDEKRTIMGCVTTLTGELNSIITHNTILTSSLQNKFTDQLNEDALFKGAEAGKKYGFGKALFSIRVHEQFAHWDHSQLASFLIGILIESDIQAMLNANVLQYRKGIPFIVGGNGILAEATAKMLEYRLPESHIICSWSENLNHLSARGALFIEQQSRKQNGTIVSA